MYVGSRVRAPYLPDPWPGFFVGTYSVDGYEKLPCDFA